jgi:hypothetical protein
LPRKDYGSSTNWIDNAGYNVPLAVTISGGLDIDRLEQAINVIIARHENLRTVFPGHEGQAQQVILDKVDFKLERIDLSHHTSRGERDNKAREICQREVARPFDQRGAAAPRQGDQAGGAGACSAAQYAPHHHRWLVAGHIDKELGLIMESLRQA